MDIQQAFGISLLACSVGIIMIVLISQKILTISSEFLSVIILREDFPVRMNKSGDAHELVGLCFGHHECLGHFNKDEDSIRRFGHGVHHYVFCFSSFPVGSSGGREINGCQ